MKAIIGFDPGVTCGLAIIDLEGKLVHLGSYRNTPLSRIVEIIISKSEPVIIGADVSPAQPAVVKLAATLGAEVFAPAISLTIEEKRFLTRNDNTKDDHQRDSLAAARIAHKVYTPLLQKIRTRSKGDVGEVFEKIVTGEASKISDALEEEVKRLPKHDPTPVRVRLLNVKRHRDKLVRELSNSREQVTELSERVRLLAKELRKQERSAYKRVRSMRAVKSLKAQVDAYKQKEKLHLKRIRDLESWMRKLETWLVKRKTSKFVVSDEGPGIKVGTVYLAEDARAEIERIIREHKHRKKKGFTR